MMIPDGATAAIKWIDHRQRIYGALKALQRNGALELLANPRLLSLSGEEASFLVGGEIPVPVAQSTSSAGVPNVTIQWKEYGIRLHFLPTIIDTNLVNLKIKPEISSLDWANMVSFGGYDIPALRTRKASATVELNSEQSIVLGGLIATESFKTVKRIPILGHIPILNFFFSRKETSTVETELLIVVSPRIIGLVADEAIPPLPTLEKDESISSATGSLEGDLQTDAVHQSDSLAVPADR
jgi:pilus assembly protein CpaC